jgi:predicted MFS family arabinose efflux permease
LTGALWFAAFNALWATLAIHVADAPFHYSVQQAGFFGFLGAAGIMGAKVSGQTVNRLGPRRLIAAALSLMVCGFAVMLNWGDTLTGMIAGVILVVLGVFGAQIPNQVRVFSIDPDAQSRMNAVYMLFYYLGGAVGSAIGVKVMGIAGWPGLTLFAIALLVAALLNHFLNSARANVKA